MKSKLNKATQYIKKQQKSIKFPIVLEKKAL